MRQQVSGPSRPESRPESESEREHRLWPRAAHVQPLRFRRAPLLAAAVCFALGESLTQLPPATTRPTIVLLLAAVACAALALIALRRTLRLAVPAVLALWIAAGLWSAQLQPVPAPQTALLAYADGLSRTVQGRVLRIRTLPPRTAPNSDSDADFDGWDDSDTAAPVTAVDLSLTAIEQVTPDTTRMVPIAGGVRTLLFAGKSPPPTLHCGDTLQMPLRLRAPERYRDPGAWQYADYLLEQGIAATASSSADKLSILRSTASAPLFTSLQCRIFSAQSWAAARLLA